MGNHSDGSPQTGGAVATAGQTEKFADPGLPPHRLRLADTDPKAAKRAERQVTILFIVSVIGTIVAEISTGTRGGIGRLIIEYAQSATGDPADGGSDELRARLVEAERRDWAERQAPAGTDPEDALWISAKTGMGVPEVLEAAILEQRALERPPVPDALHVTIELATVHGFGDDHRRILAQTRARV